MTEGTGGLPLLVDLRGRRVLVVGGGRVAAGKSRGLIAAGGRIVVVAPDVCAELGERVVDGTVTWHRRTYRDGDLDDVWLVVAATASAEVNAAVAAAAEDRRMWCVRVDAGGSSSAALLGTVRRGPLLLAVSTSGTAPALTARIRREIEARYGPEWGELAALMGELRADPRIRAKLAGIPAPERRARWHGIIDPSIVDLIRSGRRREAKEVATACLCSSSD